MRLIFLFSMQFLFNCSFAQQAPDVIKSYKNAWLEPDSIKRFEEIKTFWAENGEYQDAVAKLTGQKKLNEMIQKFRADYPNSIATSSPAISFENYRTWSWKIVNKEKNLFLDGRDFVRLDSNGKILELIGFWGNDFENGKGGSPTDEEIKRQNKKVVAQYFECLFKTADFVAMKKIIAEHAVYSQADGLPYGGTYTGFDEWIKMYTKAQTYFYLTIEKDPVYYSNSTDNDIMLSFIIRCKAKSSGKEIVMPISEYFKLKDGFITSIRAFYFDTKTFADFIK